MDSVPSWGMAFVFGALPFLIWVLCSWNKFWFLAILKVGSGYRLPPGSMGLPLVGELFTFLWYFTVVRRPEDFINSKRRRYGDGVGMYRTHLFGSPSIIACSPEVNKFVLQSNDLFSSSSYLELLGENSFATLNGETHKRRRNCVLNTINSPDAVANSTIIVQPLLVSTFSLWAEKGRIKAADEVRKLSFENIGHSFISFKPGPMLHTLDQWFHGYFEGFKSLPWKIPGTSYYHALQCKKKLTLFFREELEKRKVTNSASGHGRDLMENLMRVKDEGGIPLSDDEVVDMTVGLILAGYRTTSNLFTWALYYLAKNKSVHQKLREENLAVNKNDDFLTSADIAQLKYTNKVVEETIRLSNIAIFLFREAVNDVTYKGYLIPKGWTVLVWLHHLHTNPENFTDPLIFDPDRWNNTPKPGTYQPFGGGPRICAGNKLVRTQLATFLHHLVIGYTWELINPDAKIVYLPEQMPADGLEIKFSKL
ncbi:ent-kaurenoic acid monooxygenase [Ranunculus cassubicifolius]